MVSRKATAKISNRRPTCTQANKDVQQVDEVACIVQDDPEERIVELQELERSATDDEDEVVENGD